MTKTKLELDNITEEIALLEINCKKKEALFSNILYLYRQIFDFIEK